MAYKKYNGKLNRIYYTKFKNLGTVILKKEIHL